MIRRYKKPIVVFLILSLLVHGSLFLSVALKWIKSPPPPPAKIEVEFKDLAPTPKKKVARVKAPPIQATDQIVEQKDQINDEIDPNTRFLSAHNQKVIKQTKAERSGQFRNTAEGGKPDEGQKDGDKEQKKALNEKTAPTEEGELPELKDLAPKFSLSPGPKAPDSDKTGDPSQSDDYLKDVNTGMQTLLSTREFVYYSYYARIKEAIRQHWEPNVREKVKIIYRQGRNIASAKDRVTQVMVTLDGKGELIRVEILTQSGVEQLDNAAIEAFKAAAPFPNPPKGMVEPDGTIKIRWDFVLEA